MIFLDAVSEENLRMSSEDEEGFMPYEYSEEEEFEKYAYQDQDSDPDRN